MSLDYYAFLKKNKPDDEPHLAYLWYEAQGSKSKDEIRSSWQESLNVADNPWQNKHFDFCQIPDSFAFTLDASAISWLPRFSFMLQIPFKMRKPYLSKGEENFYIVKNPLCREKVFKTPMVAASSWKGALRAAMLQLLVRWWTELDAAEKEERSNRKQFVAWRLQLVRLFGTERSFDIDDKNYNQYLDKIGGKHQARWFRRYLRRFISKNGFLAGRLYFYPTFFKEAALEVINPHDRKTGTSQRGPILLECVPINAAGSFSLLYVPLGPFGKSKETHREAVAQDLLLLAEGIRAMLTLYGFGAKTSSGFGVVEEQLSDEGKLSLKAVPPPEESESDSAPEESEELPRYLEAPARLIEELRSPDGTLKGEEEYKQWLKSRGRKYNKEREQLYNKARSWWEREGKQLMAAASHEASSEPEPQPLQEELPPVTEVTVTFKTLDEFLNQVQKVAEDLKKGGVT